MYKIFNEDCRKTLRNMKDKTIDCVITSPFYNTNKKAGKSRTLRNCNVKEGQYDYVRYDNFVDNISNEKYSNFMIEVFDLLDLKLKDNGVVLLNLSYGSENTECLWLTIADIIKKTNFTIADCIVWKKSTALPNCCSPNKLTRIVEFVFVFHKKGSEKTFLSNKKTISVRKTGQKMYESFYNLIEARNNDGANKLNKATFSSELVEKLIDIYVPVGSMVYDPFNGTGTTGVACMRKNIEYIGSEISQAQVEYSNERIEKEYIKTNII